MATRRSRSKPAEKKAGESTTPADDRLETPEGGKSFRASFGDDDFPPPPDETLPPPPEPKSAPPPAPAPSPERVLPRVDLRVWAISSGIKPDQLAGFVRYAIKNNLGRMTIPEWREALEAFRNRPTV